MYGPNDALSLYGGLNFWSSATGSVKQIAVGRWNISTGAEMYSLKIGNTTSYDAVTQGLDAVHTPDDSQALVLFRKVGTLTMLVISTADGSLTKFYTTPPTNLQATIIHFTYLPVPNQALYIYGTYDY